MIDAYKFAPPNILVVPRIFPEVLMLHVVENEAQWVLWGGVDSYERHDVWVGETATCEYFVAEPLPIGFQVRGSP